VPKFIGQRSITTKKTKDAQRRRANRWGETKLPNRRVVLRCVPENTLRILVRGFVHRKRADMGPPFGGHRGGNRNNQRAQRGRPKRSKGRVVGGGPFESKGFGAPIPFLAGSMSGENEGQLRRGQGAQKKEAGAPEEKKSRKGRPTAHPQEKKPWIKATKEIPRTLLKTKEGS